MGISLRRKLVAFGLVVLLARSLHKLLKILRRRKRLVPKARLLRLSCGHLFEFLRYGGFTDQFFKQLHKASEEEVVPFWIGNKEYFSIIGVSNSRVALQWCHDRKYSGPLASLLGEGSFLLGRTPAAVRMRQEVARYFSSEDLRLFVHSQLTDTFAAEIGNLPVAAVNFYEILKSNIQGLLSKILFGSGPQADEEEGRAIISEAMSLFEQSNSWEFSSTKPKSYVAYLARVDRLRSRVFEVLQRTAETEEEETCVVDVLRKVASEDSGSLDHAVVSAILSLIYASHDTLLSGCFWACFHLALYSEAQDKVADEVDDCVGRRFLPSLEEVGSLEYLDCFVHESLRLLSAVPIVYGKCTTSFVIENVHVPKGATVCLPLFKSMADGVEFGSDCEAFNPERFRSLEGIASKPRNSLLCFGGGARKCFGQHFALLYIKLIVSIVVQQYTVKLSSRLEDCRYALGPTNVNRPFKPIYFDFEERPKLFS